ncbi:hypothetical protein CMV16_14220 [Peribacillus simplex]|nr:hypothetical protein CMV16_14220 [Peribacillus simplex]
MFFATYIKPAYQGPAFKLSTVFMKFERPPGLVFRGRSSLGESSPAGSPLDALFPQESGSFHKD